eukprot:251986-Prorocentrum_minimum.AAC.1
MRSIAANHECRVSPPWILPTASKSRRVRATDCGPAARAARRTRWRSRSRGCSRRRCLSAPRPEASSEPAASSPPPRAAPSPAAAPPRPSPGGGGPARDSRPCTAAGACGSVSRSIT